MCLNVANSGKLVVWESFPKRTRILTPFVNIAWVGIDTIPIPYALDYFELGQKRI